MRRNGQTVGKKLMNIRVVTPQGGKITSGQAWIRALVRIACVFILPTLLSSMCGF
ncbi:MAG: RDD family protein, partial [Thermoanaerobaculia bacterium]